MDYRTYHPTFREKMKCLGLAVLLSGAIAFLFYGSVWGLVLIPVLYLILKKRKERTGLEQVQKKLAKEFLDALRTISSALQAGISMENAWKEAEKEMAALHGKESYMYQELSEMNRSIELNIPIEKLLTDFSVRCGNSDILSFAEVFSFAKRSGGNFVTIIEGTSEHMRARYDTEREIEVLVASRKMEQKVMNAIPMFILAYLKVSSMDFLDVLYGNMAGVLFMTLCLLAYGGSVLLAEKILRIRM